MLSGVSRKMVEQMEARHERMKSEVAAIQVEASTGGGMVTVRLQGTKRIRKISIEPEALEDIEMLQDMIRGACNEAMHRLGEEAGKKAGNMFLLPPGLVS